MINLGSTKQDWEVILLSDGAWSVRFQRTEQWILYSLSRSSAAGIEKMMNSLDLKPGGLQTSTRPTASNKK